MLYIGYSSLKNGQLELGLHRRSSRDDSLGLEENLRDSTRVSIKLWGMVNSSKESMKYMKKLTHLLNHPSLVFYSPYQGSIDINQSN